MTETIAHKSVIALDDEPLALRLIEKYMEKMQGWELKATFTDSFTVASFLEKQPVDLILSDINMPNRTGLQFINSLPITSRPLVIFVTAYKEYAHDGYDLDVLDYLVKPVSFERFQKALTKAEEWLAFKQHTQIESTSKRPQYLMVYSEYQLVRINVSDILYIQSMGDYVKIHITSSPKPLMTLERLKNIASKLAAKNFIRIHRSYVVNTTKITALQKSKLQVGDTWLPISQTYQKKLDFLLSS